jgi:hypothetical protein
MLNPVKPGTAVGLINASKPVAMVNIAAITFNMNTISIEIS